MSKVIIDQTLSLDGFVTGPEDDARHPLGTGGGERLFDWYQGGEPMRGDGRFAPTGKNRAVVEATFDAYGAFVTGRRTYDFTNGWKGTHPLARHVVVLTHRAPTDFPKGDSTFVFTHDIRNAIQRAKRVAGRKDICLGTCDVAQQALDAGLVDELFLHVAPIVLGGGRRLFQRVERSPIAFEQTDVIVGPGATHVRYRIPRARRMAA